VTDEFEKYRRTDVAELRPYKPEERLVDVSISAADRKNGSPKSGDMIARNPKDHTDQWLVAKKYFEDNFKPMNNAFEAGKAAALARYKMSNMQAGAAGYNPTLNGQSMGGAMSPPSMKPPAPPSPPMAAGAAKAKVLG
jgi:hypothetical protein